MLLNLHVGLLILIGNVGWATRVDDVVVVGLSNIVKFLAFFSLSIQQFPNCHIKIYI